MNEMESMENQSRPNNRSSKQKIMKLKEELQSKLKTPHQLQVDRIRQLKESYDVALIKADEMVRGGSPNTNLYVKVHGERAKRVYLALSSLIYSTIAVAKVQGLEDFVRQTAITLPVGMIDLQEWEYVLKLASECRSNTLRAPINNNNNLITNNHELQKKYELCHFLAIQPIRNTKDEIQLLRQYVLDSLNEHYEQLSGAMNMIMLSIQKIHLLHAKDSNLHKMNQLQLENTILQEKLEEEKEKQMIFEQEKQVAYHDLLQAKQEEITEINTRHEEELKELYEEQAEKEKVTQATIEKLEKDVLKLTQEKSTLVQAVTQANTQQTQALTALQHAQDTASYYQNHHRQDILEVTASLSIEHAMSRAMMLVTILPEFQNKEKIITDLHAYEQLKLDNLTRQEEFNKIKKMKDDYLRINTELVEFIGSLQTTLDDKEQTMNELTKRVQSTEKELQSSQKKHEALEEAYTGLLASYNTLQAQHEATETLTKEQASLIDTLQKEKQELLITSLRQENSKIPLMEEYITAVTTEQHHLKEQIVQLMNKTEEVNNKLLERPPVTAIEEEVEEQKKMTVLEEQMQLLTQEMLSLKSQVQNIDLVPKEKEVEKAKEVELQALQVENERLQALLGEVEQLLAAIQFEAAKVSGKQKEVAEEDEDGWLKLHTELLQHHQAARDYHQATEVMLADLTKHQEEDDELLVALLAEREGQETEEADKEQQQQQQNKLMEEKIVALEQTIADLKAAAAQGKGNGKRKKSVGFAADNKLAEVMIITEAPPSPSNFYASPTQKMIDAILLEDAKEATGETKDAAQMETIAVDTKTAVVAEEEVAVAKQRSQQLQVEAGKAANEKPIADSTATSADTSHYEANTPMPIALTAPTPRNTIVIMKQPQDKQSGVEDDSKEKNGEMYSNAIAEAVDAATKTDLEQAQEEKQSAAAEVAVPPSNSIEAFIAQGIMVACPPTIQGKAGWYLSPEGQYFYFCQDPNTQGEFLLLCGPISPAMYALAQEEVTHIPCYAATAQLGQPSQQTAQQQISIDRSAVHANHLQTGALLLDLQAIHEQPAQQQAEQPQEQQPVAASIAAIPITILGQPLLPFLPYPPSLQQSFIRLTAIVRGFLGRRRMKRLRLLFMAHETGVLMAMPPTTVQGESGWYAGPNGTLFYFVMKEGKWIYAAGPITMEEYYHIAKQASMASQPFHHQHHQQLLQPTTNIQHQPMMTKVLTRCDFKLGGIQGDLAESGEVYLSSEDLKLYLALPVDELMVELQQPSGGINGQLLGGGSFLDASQEGSLVLDTPLPLAEGSLTDTSQEAAAIVPTSVAADLAVSAPPRAASVKSAAGGGGSTIIDNTSLLSRLDDSTDSLDGGASFLLEGSGVLLSPPIPVSNGQATAAAATATATAVSSKAE